MEVCRFKEVEFLELSMVLIMLMKSSLLHMKSKRHVNKCEITS